MEATHWVSAPLSERFISSQKTYATANSTLYGQGSIVASVLRAIDRFRNWPALQVIIRDRLQILCSCIPAQHGANCSCVKNTGIRSWISAADSFGSVMIIVQDLSRSPSTFSTFPKTGSCEKWQASAADALKRITKDRFGVDGFRPRIEGRHPQFFERLAPPPRD